MAWSADAQFHDDHNYEQHDEYQHDENSTQQNYYVDHHERQRPRRPRRTAQARRDQYKRSEIRTIERILRGYQAMEHRGNHVSQLGMALQNALQEAHRRTQHANEHNTTAKQHDSPNCNTKAKQHGPPSDEQRTPRQQRNQQQKSNFNPVCKHWLNSRCTWGDKCKFVHRCEHNEGRSIDKEEHDDVEHNYDNYDYSYDHYQEYEHHEQQEYDQVDDNNEQHNEQANEHYDSKTQQQDYDNDRSTGTGFKQEEKAQCDNVEHTMQRLYNEWQDDDVYTKYDIQQYNTTPQPERHMDRPLHPEHQGQVSTTASSTTSWNRPLHHEHQGQASTTASSTTCWNRPLHPELQGQASTTASSTTRRNRPLHREHQGQASTSASCTTRRTRPLHPEHQEGVSTTASCTTTPTEPNAATTPKVYLSLDKHVKKHHTAYSNSKHDKMIGTHTKQCTNNTMMSSAQYKDVTYTEATTSPPANNAASTHARHTQSQELHQELTLIKAGATNQATNDDPTTTRSTTRREPATDDVDDIIDILSLLENQDMHDALLKLPPHLLSEVTAKLQYKQEQANDLQIRTQENQHHTQSLTLQHLALHNHNKKITRADIGPTQLKDAINSRQHYEHRTTRITTNAEQTTRTSTPTSTKKATSKRDHHHTPKTTTKVHHTHNSNEVRAPKQQDEYQSPQIEQEVNEVAQLLTQGYNPRTAAKLMPQAIFQRALDKLPISTYNEVQQRLHAHDTDEESE